jgi:hypothetical protein
LWGMDWPDYLRDQAAMYRKLAEEADDPFRCVGVGLRRDRR